jgi:transcription antitermination factor NusG
MFWHEGPADVPGDAGDLRWFALRVKPRHEKCVALILQNKGYEQFLPLQRCERRSPGRSKKVELPLFPGYVFCRFDVLVRLPLLTTPGVLQVVGLGRTPVPVEDREIEAIQRIVASDLSVEPWPYLEAGQHVEIEDGPLRGLRGILLSFKTQLRLVVSVSLLQRAVAIEVDRESVSPVPLAGSKPGAGAWATAQQSASTRNAA